MPACLRKSISRLLVSAALLIVAAVLPAAAQPVRDSRILGLDLPIPALAVDDPMLASALGGLAQSARLACTATEEFAWPLPREGAAAQATVIRTMIAGTATRAGFRLTEVLRNRGEPLPTGIAAFLQEHPRQRPGLWLWVETPESLSLALCTTEPSLRFRNWTILGLALVLASLPWAGRAWRPGKATGTAEAVASVALPGLVLLFLTLVVVLF